MALIGDIAEATGRPVDMIDMIDMIDLRTVGEPLLGQIREHGRGLPGSEEAHGSRVSRHCGAIDAYSPGQRRRPLSPP